MNQFFTTVTYVAVGLAGVVGVACSIAEERIVARATIVGDKPSRFDATRVRGKRWHWEGE